MRFKARQKGYQVLGNLPPNEVLPFTGPKAPDKEFFGLNVKMTSLRYQTFNRSLKCVCCGLVGEVMLLEMPFREDIPHFNLYAYREGGLVQMTKDHIKPKSKGGKNVLNNMQTMCHHCNELKGNYSSKLKRLREIQDGVRNIYVVMRHDQLVSDTFATSKKGLAETTSQVIMDFYGWDRGDFEVRVSIRLGIIEVFHGEGVPLKFQIKPIRRI